MSWMPHPPLILSAHSHEQCRHMTRRSDDYWWYQLCWWVFGGESKSAEVKAWPYHLLDCTMTISSRSCLYSHWQTRVHYQRHWSIWQLTCDLTGGGRGGERDRGRGGEKKKSKKSIELSMGSSFDHNEPWINEDMKSLLIMTGQWLY